MNNSQWGNVLPILYCATLTFSKYRHLRYVSKKLIGTRLKKTNPNTIKSQCHQFISVSHPHATNKLLHNLHEPEYIKRCTKT